VIVRLDLSYDGTSFRGWARQRGPTRTVQGVLEDALGRILGSEPRLSVAGRTDAGVHAAGQVASFAAPPGVDPERLQRALNGMLGPEVVVRSARRAPDGFDARHSAKAREYVYRIDTGPVPDPFTSRFVWHRPGRLALAPMRAAARRLLGQHDFAAFCRAPEPPAGMVRRVDRIAVSGRGGRVEVRIRANAFCHQMVRSIVATLVAVGTGRMEPERVGAILEGRDRSPVPAVAPAHGLTLVRVVYGPGGGVHPRRAEL